MENENILELTKENLIKCDFNSNVIEKLLSQNSKETVIKNCSETFVASIIDNKIYATKEAYRKMYFKNELDPEFPVHYLGLIPKYYELAETNFLKASKKRLTSIYNEETEKQNFKQKELQDCINAIDWHFKQPINHPIRHKPHPVIAGKQAYKTWLEKQSKSSHTTKLTAPIIKRFCELCNNSGLDKKDPDENVIAYCQRICLKFELEYSDRVRQYFDFNNAPKPTDKHLKKVIELILPRLKESDRAIIDSYIKPK